MTSREHLNKMDRIVFGLTLLIICSNIDDATGTCVHVENDDMLEYSCVGGRPDDLLSIPTETEKIRIKQMEIPVITEDMFSRFGNLWVLACSRCNIIDIEPNAFQSLVNLQQLSLDDNRLKTVKGSWFKGMEYLTYLDLNYNEITTIEDEVYENLPSLIDFRLSGNRFECLNSQAMENMSHLKRIFLSENSEFKCPNAISKFLDARGISFDKDSQWKDFDEVSVDSMVVDHQTETSTDWSSMPDHRKRLHFPTVVTTTTTEDTRTPERVSSTFETTHYPLYAPVRVTITSDHNEKISQLFPPVDSSAIVATTNKPEVPRYPPTIADPYLPDMATTITTEQPFIYPSTQPWPIVTENDSEYRKPLDYSEEYNPTRTTFPFDSRPTNRETLPPLVDPKYILSTQPPETYWTQNGILIEPNYPLPNPSFSPGLNENDIETIQTEDIHFTIRPPQIPPEIVQPAAPSDLLQVPYYNPTVTIQRPLQSSIAPNYGQNQQQSMTVVETTTDKPFPQCPSSSPISVELKPFLIFLTFILNIIVLRF
ncbi:hypothetical protein M0804_008557 [Polistes exclamans]|nr:hypothetical protein M0804_008557 [Polistes exclamans]